MTSSDAWIACTGLDPRPNESGARIGRRRLSKRGNASLRQWTAQPFVDIFEP
nr:transposase [Stenotrophomonas pavanii]